MSGGGPCLGYPSRTAAARALLGKGVSKRDAAAQIGISVTTLSALLAGVDRASRARGPGRPVRGFDPAVVGDCTALASLAIDAPVRRIFRREAERRGEPIDGLMARVLEAVARDDLFAAVLDVEGDAP